MNRTLLLFVWMLLAPMMTLAQGQISGIVRDASTGNPLAGAHVKDSRSDLGAVTNEKGQFTLTLTDNRQRTLQITHLGFETEMLLVNPSQLKGQLVVDLQPAMINANAVVVTGTKRQQRVMEIPGRTEWLPASQLKAIPVGQVDEYLKTIPGIQVSREHGVVDHNSTVSMRGLSGGQQGRYLVLIDGIPVNKADGGSVNWNSLNTSQISRIEVAKGPGSSLYGGHAMGGVMNIIRSKPIKAFEGSAEVDYGSMNTRRGRVSIGGRPAFADNKLYWNLNGFGGASDGYNQVPLEERDTTDVPSGMEEWRGGARLGYQITPNHLVELSASYWWDRRGSGTRIFSETGTYFAHQVFDYSLKYEGKAGAMNWSAALYRQDEDYERLNESIKAKGDSYDYTSYSVTSRRIDQGILLNADYTTGRHRITIGGDVKDGSVDGKDIYTTSSDIVTNQGRVLNLSAYLEDRVAIVKERLFLVAGLRYDHTTFKDGAFFITDPTSATSILTDLENLNLQENTWSEISPKLALKYSSKNGHSAYLSYGHGFRPSILDDLCRSGFISGGFKRANPFLGPERLDNIELGGDVQINQSIKFTLSAYHSRGKDFIYLVGTGDSIEQGTRKRPIREARNLSKVTINGVESSLQADFGNGLTAYLNYAFTHSIINEHLPEAGEADLSGNYLVYVPTHQGTVGLTWRNKILNVHVQGQYLSQQWMDDQNTESIPGHINLDAKLFKEFGPLQVFVSGQNLTNFTYLQSKGNLSMGRFLLAGLGYKF